MIPSKGSRKCTGKRFLSKTIGQNPHLRVTQTCTCFSAQRAVGASSARTALQRSIPCWLFCAVHFIPNPFLIDY